MSWQGDFLGKGPSLFSSQELSLGMTFNLLETIQMARFKERKSVSAHLSKLTDFRNGRPLPLYSRLLSAFPSPPNSAPPWWRVVRPRSQLVLTPSGCPWHHRLLLPSLQRSEEHPFRLNSIHFRFPHQCPQ